MRSTIDTHFGQPVVTTVCTGKTTVVRGAQSGLCWEYNNQLWECTYKNRQMLLLRAGDAVGVQMYKNLRPQWIIGNKTYSLKKSRLRWSCGLKVCEQYSSNQLPLAYLFVLRGYPTIVSSTNSHGIALAIALSSRIYVS